MRYKSGHSESLSNTHNHVRPGWDLSGTHDLFCRNTCRHITLAQEPQQESSRRHFSEIKGAKSLTVFLQLHIHFSFVSSFLAIDSDFFVCVYENTHQTNYFALLPISPQRVLQRSNKYTSLPAALGRLAGTAAVKITVMSGIFKNKSEH